MDTINLLLTPPSSLMGKIKQLCPTMYFTLSSWERHHLDTSTIPGLDPKQTFFPMSCNPIISLPPMDLDSFKHDPPSTLLTPIIEPPSSSLPLNTGGVPSVSSPNLSTDRVNLPTTPNSLNINIMVGTTSLLSSIQAQDIDSIGLTSSIPPSVDFHLSVPLPTYLGKSTINDLQDIPSTSCHDPSTDPIKKDFSWSRSLGLETSPIKTRNFEGNPAHLSHYLLFHLWI
jgi:hypothetical protein